MTDDEIINAISTTIANYRRDIIHRWVFLEKAIETYIIHYLSNDPYKQVEIFELLLDRLSFHQKREVLSAIFNKKSRAEGFVKTKNNSWPHSKFIDELRKINDDRNKFAHYMANLFDTGIKEYPTRVGLIELRDASKTIWYEKKDVLDIIQRIDRCGFELEKLINSK